MLIIGAKGFAKEVFEVFSDLNQLSNIAFFDDININQGDKLYDIFSILKNENDIKDFFMEHGCSFTIGIGNPVLRYKLYKKISNLGGQVVSSISPFARIGSKEVYIGNGSNVLSNSIFSNSVKIGNCCIVYYNVIITHDLYNWRLC